MWLPGGIKDRVKIAEGLSSTPSKLAINLLNALFTSEQMASGNCTPSTTHDILDQKRIKEIRCKLLPSYANVCITPPLISNVVHMKYLYPCEPSEESKRWKSIIQTNMNAKCRHHRAANKKLGKQEMLPLKVLEMMIAPTQNQLHETHLFRFVCMPASVKRMFKQNTLI